MNLNANTYHVVVGWQRYSSLPCDDKMAVICRENVWLHRIIGRWISGVSVLELILILPSLLFLIVLQPDVMFIV